MRRLCTRIFPMKPIHFQSHSALNGGSPDLLTNHVLDRVAAEVKRTIPQVLIRWSLQKGHSKLPRHNSGKGNNNNCYLFLQIFTICSHLFTVIS